MPEPPPAVPFELHEDHIETDRDIRPSCHHIGCDRRDSPPLGPVDLAGKPLETSPAGFDLHHDQRPPFRGHGKDVDLVSAASNVAVEDPESSTAEPASGDAFTPAPGAVGTTAFPKNHFRARKRESAMSTIFVSISWRSS